MSSRRPPSAVNDGVRAPIDTLFAGLSVEGRLRPAGQPAPTAPHAGGKRSVSSDEETDEFVLGKVWGVPPEDMLPALKALPLAKLDLPPLDGRDPRARTLLSVLAVVADQNGDGTFDTDDVERLAGIGGELFRDPFELLKFLDLQPVDEAKLANFTSAAPKWKQGTPEAVDVAADFRATMLETLPDLAVQGVLMEQNLETMLECVGDPVSAAIQTKAMQVAKGTTRKDEGFAVDRLIATTSTDVREYIDKAVEEFVPLFRGALFAERAFDVPFTSAMEAALLADASVYSVAAPDDVEMQNAFFLMDFASYPLDNQRGVEALAATLPLTVTNPPKAKRDPDPEILPEAPESPRYSDVDAQCQDRVSNRIVNVITDAGARNPITGGVRVAEQSDPFYVSMIRTPEGEATGQRASLATFFHQLGVYLRRQHRRRRGAAAAQTDLHKLAHLPVPWDVNVPGHAGANVRNADFLQYIRCQMTEDETPTQALVKSFAAAVKKRWKPLGGSPTTYEGGAEARAQAALRVIDQMVARYNIAGRPVMATGAVPRDADIAANGSRIAVMVEYVTALVECADAEGFLGSNLWQQTWKQLVKRTQVEASGSYLYNPQGLPNPPFGPNADPPDVVARLAAAHQRARLINPGIVGERDRLRPAVADTFVTRAANYAPDFNSPAVQQAVANAQAQVAGPGPGLAAAGVQYNAANPPPAPEAIRGIIRQLLPNAGDLEPYIAVVWRRLGLFSGVTIGATTVRAIWNSLNNAPAIGGFELVWACGWKSASSVCGNVARAKVLLRSWKDVLRDVVWGEGIKKLLEGITHFPYYAAQAAGVSAGPAALLQIAVWVGLIIMVYYVARERGLPDLAGYWEDLTQHWERERLDKTLRQEFRKRLRKARKDNKTEADRLEKLKQQIDPKGWF